MTMMNRRLLSRTRGAVQRQPATSSTSMTMKISAGNGCRNVLTRNTGEPRFPLERVIWLSNYATEQSREAGRYL